MVRSEFTDYQRLYDEQCKETEKWRTAAELFRESLRDRFAMAALKETAGELKDTHPPVEIAEWCYIMAEAMLEARQK